MLITPILLAGMTWFGANWIEGKFQAQALVTSEVRKDVDVLRNDLPAAKERITVLESNMDRGRKDREEFQRQTLQQLERLQMSINTLTGGVAALTATIEAQQRQLDQQR